MKNQKHPIDDLFQRGLNQHSVPPPMHVWERVEESRAISQRGKRIRLSQRFAVVSSAAAVLLVGVWLNLGDSPRLGSFPILTQSALANVDEIQSLEDDLVSPTQEAELLSAVTPVLAPKKQVGEKVRQTTQRAAKQGVVVEIPIAEIALKGITEEHANQLDFTQAEEKEIVAQMEVTSVSPLEETKLSAIPSSLVSLDVAPLPPIPETGCARFSEGRPAIFFALTGGPSFPSRTFAAKTAENTGYATQRANTESARLSYNASARLSVVFPWGGALRTGVNYSQFNEQLVYRNSRVRQTTITEIYGPNGEVIGSDTSFITENSTLTYNNRHRLIDIPFQLGYEVRYNKVTIAANAGLNLNVAYSQKGNYLGPRDLLPTRFDSDDPDLEPIYKTKVGLGWQASLGLHYQLSDRLDLMAEPYVRHYPSSFTTNDYPLSQKYLIGGLDIGLRVLL